MILQNNIELAGTGFVFFSLKNLNQTIMTNIILLRYLLIDYQFRKTPNVTLENLKEFLEHEFKLLSQNLYLTKSTIKTDFKNMKTFFALDINFSFQKNLYAYGKNNYSFLQLPDFMLYRLIIQLKLQIALGKTFNLNKYVSFDNQTANMDYENLLVYINAILRKRIIEIVYKSEGAKRSRRYSLNLLIAKECI